MVADALAPEGARASAAVVLGTDLVQMQQLYFDVNFSDIQHYNHPPDSSHISVLGIPPVKYTSWKTRANLLCIVNILVADALVTQGAMASAALVLSIDFVQMQ